MCYQIIQVHTVLETVLMGNKVLHKVKTEIDALYLDYIDESDNSDAASMLSKIGITKDYSSLSF